jgi:fumarate reductase flavoprotein subunit
MQYADRAQVVVIGAGACGLTAALAANESGADVVVLERDARPWGSTAMSIGAVCGVGTAEQRKHGVTDSASAFVADVMAKTAGRADPDLTAAIARESGPAIDWLAERHDVPLLLDFAWRGLGHSVPRLHVPPGRTGEELLSLLLRAAARHDIPLLSQASVVALHADEHQRIVAVEIARPGGAVELLGCDAVVLATCGFGGNHAMIAENIPSMAQARYFGHEGNRGDGILWGQSLGAALADMTAYQGLGTLAEPHAVIVPHTLLIDGGILVNARGERFTHELENISGMCVPVLAQPGASAWVVCSQSLLDASLVHSVELGQLVEAGAVKQAASIDELAALTNLSGQLLSSELNAIRALRESGHNDRFGRRFAECAKPEGPWCAIKVTGALFHTQGGLVVDDNARVKRADGRLLPNLFAGGGAARSISGPDVTGYLPAVGLCMAITLGRLAGHAAAHLTTKNVAATA